MRLTAIWVYLASQPLLWLTLTVGVYWLAKRVYEATNGFALLNPVLVSIVVIVALLLATGTEYHQYFDGAQFIHFLLGPATVALGLPLWERRAELRATWGRLALAGLAGGGTAALMAVALGWALGLPDDVVRSLAPKSITAPVAMGVAEKIGGVPALSAVFAVLTGLVGALSGKYIFGWIGIGTDRVGWMARGFALGTASHGIGASRALSVQADAGAYAGLALGLQVLLGALLIPLVARLF